MVKMLGKQTLDSRAMSRAAIIRAYTELPNKKETEALRIILLMRASMTTLGNPLDIHN
jgi:hypothetical protein